VTGRCPLREQPAPHFASGWHGKAPAKYCRACKGYLKERADSEAPEPAPAPASASASRLLEHPKDLAAGIWSISTVLGARFCDPSAFTDPAELREPLETSALEYLVEGEFRRDDRPADQGFFSKRWMSMDRLLEAQPVAQLDEVICAFESALEQLREAKLSAAQSAARIVR